MSAAAPLDEGARASLERFLALLAAAPASLSTATEPGRAWDVHVRDSLSGLAVEELREARRIADLGSGPGFPGVAIAAVRPAAQVDLIESVGRKCRFLAEALEGAGISNASVVCGRSEEWAVAEGREAYDVVTARAVGGLTTIAELASPLLRPGGALVAWKGRRERAGEERLAAAGEGLAMGPAKVVEVVPFRGSRPRHLYVIHKLGPTPERLPRRPGMARKRPL